MMVIEVPEVFRKGLNPGSVIRTAMCVLCGLCVQAGCSGVWCRVAWEVGGDAERAQ